MGKSNYVPQDLMDKQSMMADIINDHFGIPIQMLKSKSRKHEIIAARAMCYNILYHEHRQSLANIGYVFGGKDHATVLNGIATHESMYKSNHKGYADQYDKFYNLYQSMINKEYGIGDDFYILMDRLAMIEEEARLIRKTLIDKYMNGQIKRDNIRTQLNNLPKNEQDTSTGDTEEVQFPIEESD